MVESMAKKVTGGKWEEIGITAEELARFDIPEKRKCFAYHYVMGSCNGRFNGKQAAIDSGYAPKAAEAQASQILRHLKVKELIGFITLKQLEPLKDKFRSDVIELALAITGARLEHYVNQDGSPAFSSWAEVDSRAVKSIVNKPGKYGDTIEIKLHDPKDWVLILDKYMDLAAKADMTVTIKKESDLDDLTDEQLLEYMKRKKD